MFADTLKKMRNEKSITQTELADTIHVSRSLVAKWEQSKSLPTEDSLKEISEYFQVDINSLISNRELHDNAKRTKKNYKHLIIALIIVAAITLTASLGMLCSVYNNVDHRIVNHVVESATYDYSNDRYTNIKFESTDIEYNYESNETTSPNFMINGKKRDFNYSTIEIRPGDAINLDLTTTLYMNAYNQLVTKKYNINSLDVLIGNIDLAKQLTGFYIDFSDLENEPNLYSDKNNSSTSGWDISDLSFNPSSSIYYNIGTETKEENTLNYSVHGFTSWSKYNSQNTDLFMHFDALIDFNKLSNFTTSSGNKIKEMYFWYLYSDGTYSDQIIDNYHANQITTSNTISFESDSIPSLTTSTGQILSKYIQTPSNNIYYDLQFSANFTNQITPDYYKIIQFDINDSSLSTQYANSLASIDEITTSEDTFYTVVRGYTNGEVLDTKVVESGSHYTFYFSSEYGLFNSENAKRIQF